MYAVKNDTQVYYYFGLDSSWVSAPKLVYQNWETSAPTCIKSTQHITITTSIIFVIDASTRHPNNIIYLVRP